MLLVRSSCCVGTWVDVPHAQPRGSPAAGACRAAGRGAQGDVLFGGAVVNLGGGGDEPRPNSNGGGDSVRVLQSCGDRTCQFVEVRMCCPLAPGRGFAHMWVRVPARNLTCSNMEGCRWSCRPGIVCSQIMVAAQNQADSSQRLLAYRWYPTAVKNWDGRLLVASGMDADGNTGCVPSAV